MTNLEAADLLDNLIGMVSDNHDSDYDEALSKGRDILKSEPCDDCISREHIIGEIESLKKSPWFREGEKRKEGLMIDVEHLQYIARKEAVEIVVDLCIRKEKTVNPQESEDKE